MMVIIISMMNRRAITILYKLSKKSNEYGKKENSEEM